MDYLSLIQFNYQNEITPKGLQAGKKFIFFHDWIDRVASKRQAPCENSYHMRSNYAVTNPRLLAFLPLYHPVRPRYIYSRSAWALRRRVGERVRACVQPRVGDKATHFSREWEERSNRFTSFSINVVCDKEHGCQLIRHKSFYNIGAVTETNLR